MTFKRFQFGMIAATAALALGLAGPGLAKTTAARSNWAGAIEKTASGHRLGNPAAKVQVVQYMSYTCPHCADFALTGDGPMKMLYVPTGKVGYEIRHLIRDQVDLAAAVLTNCGPPERFFANHAAFLARQPRWLSLERSATTGQKARWAATPTHANLKAIAYDLDFDEIMQMRGYSVSEIDNCLTDSALADRIEKRSREDALLLGLRGTPSFLIGGTLVNEIYDWPTLQQAIDSRL